MVGDKIRQIRTQQNISLSELAARIGVSKSYISQLERNAADPSVSVLRKIAAALHVSAAFFFDESFEEPVIIKKKPDDKMILTKEGICYQYLSPNEDSKESLMMFFFSIPAGTTSDLYENTGDICVYILSGSLCIRLEENEHSLHTGDSLYLRRRISYCLSAADAPVSGIICIKHSTK